MAGYLRDARKCVSKIKHYYENAGPTGYSQAGYYECKLGTLYSRANRSVRYKGDAAEIKHLMDEVRPLMVEMKRREDEYVFQQ
jgi:hypothetical protein